MRNKVISFVKGILFVAVLLTAGFGIEHFILKVSHPKSISANSVDSADVVLVGGSILLGMSDATTHHLNALAGESRYKVSSRIIPAANSQLALKEIEKILENHVPKAILVMVGMNEAEWGTAISNIQDGRLTVGENATLLARKGNLPEWGARVRDSMEKAIATNDPKHLGWVQVSLWRGADWIKDEQFLVQMRTFVEGKLKEAIRRQEKDLEKISMLSRISALGMFFETALFREEKMVYARDIVRETNVNKKRAMYQQLILQVDAHVREGLKQLQAGGCDALLADLKGKLRIDKYWLCLMWGDGGPQSADPDVFFSTRREHFYKMYSGVQVMARMIPELRTTAFDKIPKYMYRTDMKLDFKSLGAPMKSQNTQDQVVSDIQKARSLAESKGARLFILHYPNSKAIYEPMEKVGQHTGVTTIGSKNLFDEVVQKEGFYSVFIDKALDSGHMNERGADMYGEMIARQLSPFLNKTVDERGDVIFIGGSILFSLGESTQSYLRSQAAFKNYSIVSEIIPRASSQRVSETAAAILSKSKPQLLVILAGMNEDRMGMNKYLNMLDDRLKQGHQAVSLAQQGNYKALEESMKESVAAAVSGSGEVPLHWISVLLWRGESWIQNPEFLKEMSAFLTEQIQKLEKDGGAIAHPALVTRLCSIGHSIQMLLSPNNKFGTKLGDLKIATGLSEKKELFVTHVKRIRNVIEKGLIQIEREGCDHYLASTEETVDWFEKKWLCHVWALNGPKTSDPKLFFKNRQTQIVEMYPTLQVMPSFVPELESVAASIYPSYLPLSSIADFKKALGMEMNEEGYQTFIFNLKKVQTATQEKGVRLALMHYPNSKKLKPYIDRAAKDLKVPVLGEVNVLEPTIKREGPYSVFLDRALDSGHLTEKGADIYGQSVANQLASLLQQNKSSN